MEADAAETESMCAFHSGGVGEGDDCESDLECVDCDERERFALLDSPPVTVLTGKIMSVYLEQYKHYRRLYTYIDYTI